MPIHLPISDPVLIFALAMVIFLVVPLFFERLRIPGIVGLIVAGAVVGPNGIGLLARDDTIQLLGTVGLLYLMFMVGLELDLVDFNKYRHRSVIFGSLTFLIPQAVGTGLGFALGYNLYSSFLIGAVFASHTVLAYPIASRLGIVKNSAVTMTLGGTILTEVLALLVLAVVAGSVQKGGVGWLFWVDLLGSLVVYVGLVLWGVPKLARWFFRRVGNEATSEFIFVMAVLFTIAYLAHSAEEEPIVGALLAGLALNRLVPKQGPLMNRIHFVGNALFIPFFLLSVGMLVNVRALTSVNALGIAVSFAVAVVLAKWIASWLTQRIFKYSGEEAWVVFGLSVPHASGTLAIVLVGFDIGLFDQLEVNGVVLTILVTSLLGPWLVEKYGRRVALQEEQRPYEPSEAPQRILIPLSNPATSDALLDLAFMLRGTASTEPLHPLMVVREDGEGTEAQVAEAERMLGHAVIYAAGAEVPVVPLTRVDQNIATGIARGIAETRSSTVIIGWDGGRSVGPEIFGSVLDQLLDQTRQFILVAKLGHPLNTTRRLVLVVPPGMDHHPGFFEAVRTSKTIAAELGASMLCLVVRSESSTYQEHFASVKPDVPTTFEGVADWRSLTPTLQSTLQREDLVVVMSARRGTVAWNRALERLPGLLAHLVPESFLMMYPSEVEAPRRELSFESEMPQGLTSDRILFDLPSLPPRDALQALLQLHFTDPAPLQRITEALMRREQKSPSEILPGVVLPHLRVEGLQQPLLFLGVSPEGVEFPGLRSPAHLIFLLLSPAARPGDHLKQLAAIARMVSNADRVQDLLECKTAEELFEALSTEHTSA